MENIIVKTSFVGNVQMKGKFNSHVRQIERFIEMQNRYSAKTIVEIIGSGKENYFDVHISVDSSNRYHFFLLV